MTPDVGVILPVLALVLFTLFATVALAWWCKNNVCDMLAPDTSEKSTPSSATKTT